MGVARIGAAVKGSGSGPVEQQRRSCHDDKRTCTSPPERVDELIGQASCGEQSFGEPYPPSEVEGVEANGGVPLHQDEDDRNNKNQDQDDALNNHA